MSSFALKKTMAAQRIGDLMIKIISNGQSSGTKVINTETGEDITRSISAIEWRIDAKRGLAEAKLTYLNVQVEIEGEETPDVD